MHRKKDPALVTKAKILRCRGYSYAKIGKELGIAGSTVQAWLKPGYAERRREYAREWCALNVDNWKHHQKKSKEKVRTRMVTALHGSKTRRRNRPHGYKPCTATAEELQEALERQQGKCAICGYDEEVAGNRNLNMDHCHKTGKFRAWICSSCNTTVGRLEKNLDAFLSYLETHNA